MKPSDLDRYLREFRAINKKAQPTVTTAESIHQDLLDQTRREITRVICFKLARGIYPFAPGSRRFRLTGGAA